ncbi:TBCC domain-containing protein 1 [Selaginella moellendorffii]|uniref:TBCC domain-containing protein 1 n=1 Tax=Selaginella moellendorffii TaxID=88036 RepID=UPI000D1C248F|nr:TBCC domain-containing protein 1 [Selaginella moellendorffii]XP_024516206.1 TBCC domain-containing protein 1 [Selaginella moellendorffii]|eukprot:XP_024516205.1 TBCC domain-containing protein 1 [Selaginella moellendorffii]
MRDMNATVESETTTTASAQGEPPWLHVRREPFEYGMLPLPSLMHHDGVGSLRELREKLLDKSIPQTSWQSGGANASEDSSAMAQQPSRRVGVAAIVECLGLSEAHALLVLDTLASVLPDGDDCDQLARAYAAEIDTVGAHVDDLLLFLYIQIYRRVPPRSHKDPAAVADVWPSTSPFDGFFSTLSPLQVRPTRKSVPCQVEEEAHQLAFVQKHLSSLLALLVDLEEDGAKVLSVGSFDRLGIIFRPVDAQCNARSLSQTAPFFAGSDPDMPAVPVPLAQAHDWILEHISTQAQRTKCSGKENGPNEENDITMIDAVGAQAWVPNGVTKNREWCFEGLTFVDGVTKVSTIKSESDVTGDTLKVSNCHDAVVYVLAPTKYASVFGCSDSIVVLGAVGKAVRIEHCERVQVIVPCARICIANCRECVFFLGVNQRPLILGNNYNLQVAPFNTFYPKLEAHLAQVRVDPTVNRWDKILTLGVIDPHDSLPHPAGVADAQAEGASVVPPDRFTNFLIPRWNGGESEQNFTRANPFLLPKLYLMAQQQRNKAMENLRHLLQNVPLDDNRKRDLSNAIHAHFKEWLYGSGNIRQLYDLQIADKGTE